MPDGVVLVGMPGRISVDLTGLWHREIAIRGCYAYTGDDFRSGQSAHRGSNRWAIDGTVMGHGGKNYFIWSGRTSGTTVDIGEGAQVNVLEEQIATEAHATADDRALVTAARTYMPLLIAEIRRVAIGSDHSGLALKAAIVGALRAKGVAVDVLGSSTPDPVVYPDTAARVAKSVARHEADAGIVIDGAGIGSAIAANKIPGIRAAVCHDQTMARYARQHNGANVLSLGSTLIETSEAAEVIRAAVDEEAEIIYGTIRLIRRFEERCVDLVRSGDIGSGIHPCIGQEGVAAGVCAALRPDDTVSVLYGWHPVTAALRNPARRFRKLLATENAARRLAGEMDPGLPAIDF